VQRSVNPKTPWTNDAADVAALGKLNQFCFRCHGTIIFNVFDKKAVLDKKFLIGRHLRPQPSDLAQCRCFLMPPDRKLEDGRADEIAKLVASIK
jgi:hypothetical protein